MSSLQARTFTRTSAGTAVSHAARLELLEHYLTHHEDVVRCAQLSLEWLARHAGVKQSACLAVDAESNMLVGIAAYGTVGGKIELSSWPLSDAYDPVIAALQSPVPVHFKSYRPNGYAAHAPSTPLGRGPFTAVPLGGRGSLAEEARKLRRERTLFFTIINAVTDPIMLTDIEGRLIVANARAEKLFAASEEESEGRRRAVELNNMLFSAALSRSAVEGSPEARELLLVDPSDGSDLLFEVLSTTVEDPREGTGVVSVLRNITDLRRATEQ